VTNFRRQVPIKILNAVELLKFVHKNIKLFVMHTKVDMILQVYEFRVLDAIAAGVKTGLSV
jgi:hypothetical protein